MKPNEIISKFDAFLVAHKASFTAVAIGGTALNLLGVITRETRDCDILDPSIPENILSLAVDFAKLNRSKGIDLNDSWLNNGPDSLKQNLPRGWNKRLQQVFKGKALTLFTLGRDDLLKSKLFALCDRGTDKADCIALRPSEEELKKSLDWLKYQDGNPNWPQHVDKILADLAKGLGYEL